MNTLYINDPVTEKYDFTAVNYLLDPKNNRELIRRCKTGWISFILDPTFLPPKGEDPTAGECPEADRESPQDCPRLPGVQVPICIPLLSKV